MRVKVWKEIYKANGPRKQVRVETYLRQSRLQTYIDQTRKRRTLHTNKRGNTPKGSNNYQPICAQHQGTQFQNHILKDLKTYINTNTVVVGDFNTPHHQ
jgi:hypothetical protein